MDHPVCTYETGPEHHVRVPCGNLAVVEVDQGTEGPLFLCSRHLTQERHELIIANGYTWSVIGSSTVFPTDRATP